MRVAIRCFFEAFYEALTAVVCLLFERLERTREIEIEIGRIFRGSDFNLNETKHKLPRSINTLSLKQLHEIKHAPSSAAIDAKALTEIYKKRPHLNTKAIRPRTPSDAFTMFST